MPTLIAEHGSEKSTFLLVSGVTHESPRDDNRSPEFHGASSDNSNRARTVTILLGESGQLETRKPACADI